MLIRAVTIYLTHDLIRFDLLRSQFDSIRFDSNKYSIIVNRYGANLFVSNFTELKCMFS